MVSGDMNTFRVFLFRAIKLVQENFSKLSDFSKFKTIALNIPFSTACPILSYISRLLKS